MENQRTALAGSDALPCYASPCGRVTLYLGRWQDILPLPVDAIITDQPYGTGWLRGGGKKEGQFKRRSEKAKWDELDLSWMDHAPAIVAAFCPDFGIWPMSLRMETPHVLKYRKTNPAPFGYPCEPIVSNRPVNGSWEKEAYNGDNPLHPCQKPLPLMGWLVHELTTEGQTVCDPFMGSGSTGIACIRANRRFVGIEQDPTHYATALKRITDELAQGDLFLGHNASPLATPPLTPRDDAKR
jgi:site-specific DNA-methyltransferase (adenine-specific)